MAPLGQISSARSLNGLLRSYGRDLRGWTGSVTIRYAVAVILLLSGGASVLGAIGVGLAALFHWLEARYGSNSAYGIVSGLLIFLGTHLRDRRNFVAQAAAATPAQVPGGR